QAIPGLVTVAIVFHVEEGPKTDRNRRNRKWSREFQRCVARILGSIFGGMPRYAFPSKLVHAEVQHPPAQQRLLEGPSPLGKRCDVLSAIGTNGLKMFVACDPCEIFDAPKFETEGCFE